MKTHIDRRYSSLKRARYRSKINQALSLLAEIKLLERDRQILGLIKEVRCSASLGSGVRLDSGLFYLGAGMLENASVQYLASSFLHDAYHIHQFRNRLDGYASWFKRGSLSGKSHAQIERAAIKFQLKFAHRLKLSRLEVLHLRRLLKQPYYYRLEQKDRNW